MLDALLELDGTLFKAINHAPYHEWVETFFGLITWLGSGAVFIPMLLISGAVLSRKRKLSRLATPTLIGALLLGGFTTLTLKWSVARDRPILQPQLDAQLRGERLEKRSFPSGHTQAAFSWLVALALLLKKRRYLILGVSFASLVGISRVVLGVHFPLDVIVGAIIGTSSALIAFHWTSRSHHLADPSREVSA